HTVERKRPFPVPSSTYIGLLLPKWERHCPRSVSGSSMTRGWRRTISRAWGFLLSLMLFDRPPFRFSPAIIRAMDVAMATASGPSRSFSIVAGNGHQGKRRIIRQSRVALRDILTNSSVLYPEE